jgi:hypothetical protein
VHAEPFRPPAMALPFPGTPAFPQRPGRPAQPYGTELRERVKTRLFLRWARAQVEREAAVANKRGGRSPMDFLLRR